ncbi:MAG TPA: hypothetical protein VG127_08840, partial [Rubrobacteraceae bacterium]|nr:hypothetical protein [Rubrobacteraceae bacterium]
MGAEARKVLSSLRFDTSSRSVSSLGLPDANAPGVLYALDDPVRERAAHEAAVETRISEGCWRAGPRFFFQTQHGPRSNSNPGDGIPTGWSIVGKPNYWDEYTHGRFGYGRCTEPIWCNDKFAVDYPLNRGDAIFSPFESGTVTFAGRNL